MSHYGTLLDPTYNPKHELVYQIISNYFDNPIMTKEKNVPSYSMYMAKVYDLLSIEHRYIVAFVPEDSNSLGSTFLLSDLRWSTFLTRTYPGEYKAKTFTYTKKILDIPIRLFQREDTHCQYICDDLPIDVTLVVGKNASKYDYQPKGNLSLSLETYNCILTLK